MTLGERLDRLESDYQNFRAALSWLATNSPTERALQLANHLALLWQFRGYLSEGRAWMSRLLERPGGEARTRGRALGWAGNFAWFQGDPIAARSLHEQNLALDQETGDVAHVACCLGALGRDALALGDYRESERLCEDSQSRFRALDERGAQVFMEENWNLHTLGMAAFEQMDWARAEACHRRGLEQANTLGTTLLTSYSLYGLGRVAHVQGELAHARSLLEAALANQRAFDHPDLVAVTLVPLGQVLLDLGEVGAARTALAESLVLFERLGGQVGLAHSLDAYAGLAVVERQPERAWQLVGAADRIRAAGQTPLAPADRADLERRLGPARQLLGGEAVAPLVELGRALSTAEAIGLATSGPRPVAQGTRETTGFPTLLTPREREVAALIAEGLSNRQIGERMLITRRTAAAHVEHILDKLALTSRTQVGIWAAEHLRRS